MNELIRKAAQKASQEEVFQAVAYGALKVRARRIAPNQIIKTGEYELLVAEEENGDGLVVEIILPQEPMEAMALAKAGELARYLAKWQDIKIRRGPGENMTFEKAVSR